MAQQLAPWLTASRQRLALRGLMFSLPEPRTVDPYQEADTCLRASLIS
jgi:type VI secretion system protein ImpL